MHGRKNIKSENVFSDNLKNNHEELSSKKQRYLYFQRNTTSHNKKQIKQLHLT